MHHIPDGGKDLSGDGYLHFHLLLYANDDMMIAEFIVVASLRLGCDPEAFDESFPQVSVSVCSAPCLDLADYIDGKRSYMDITLEIRNNR